MKGFHLTDSELSELRIAHRKARATSAPEAYKINAIILLGTGWKIKNVKSALLLDESALRSYVEQYKEGGVDLLISTKHKGGNCRLSDDELKVLSEELDSSIYLTTKAVISFVCDNFQKTYSLSGMRDLLHRMGYVYKKPKLVPGNPDKEAQELFVQQYEEFMKEKSSDIEVLFVDAVHPEHNAIAANGWIKRGEIREISTNSGRSRLNLHGALNIETLDVTIIESKTVNAESTINLLQTIEQKYFMATEIVLILDNARYHYSKEVKAYLLDSKVRLVFLPSYSPNLNPIERLWKYFKKVVLYNTYYESLDKFRRACINFFKNIDDHIEELVPIIQADFDLA